MPPLLNDPAHWRLRAEETRLLASQLIDPEAKVTILKMADEYDRLAERALIRMQEERAVALSTKVVSDLKERTNAPPRILSRSC
jgi:hypothetical protein